MNSVQPCTAVTALPCRVTSEAGVTIAPDRVTVAELQLALVLQRVMVVLGVERVTAVGSWKMRRPCETVADAFSRPAPATGAVSDTTAGVALHVVPGSISTPPA